MYNAHAKNILPENYKPHKRLKFLPYCSNCGKEVSKEKKYCPNCGEEIKRKTTAATKTKKSASNDVIDLFSVSLVREEDKFRYSPIYGLDWYNPRQIANVLNVLERQKKIFEKALEVQGGEGVYEKIKSEMESLREENESEPLEERISNTETVDELLDEMNLEKIDREKTRASWFEPTSEIWPEARSEIIKLFSEDSE